jgi:hypothetical protein
MSNDTQATCTARFADGSVCGHPLTEGRCKFINHKNNESTTPATDEKAFKITRPGAAYEPPHIGARLAKQLDTHRWHVLRYAFEDPQPQPETYDAVVAAKTITPGAIKKLLGKAWCARQIMWPNRQSGILVEVGASGFYLVAPETKTKPAVEGEGK